MIDHSRSANSRSQRLRKSRKLDVHKILQSILAVILAFKIGVEH